MWGQSVGKGKELTLVGMHTAGGHPDLKHPKPHRTGVTGVTQLSSDKALFGTQICAIPKLSSMLIPSSSGLCLNSPS